MRRAIDDHVIGALLNESYVHVKDGAFDQAILWAELAQQASVLGGTSRSLAECLAWRATTLLDIRRRVRPATESDALPAAATSGDALSQALDCAKKALRIYQQVGTADEIGHAEGLISTVYREMGKLAQSIEYRIASIGSRIADPDASTSIAYSVDALVETYWALNEPREARRVAQLLLDGTATKAAQIESGLSLTQRAALFDILGAAARDLDLGERAFSYWEHAIACCHQAGSTEEQFVVLGRMQEYAAELEDLAAAVTYGEACVQAAGVDIEPERLGNRYYLLALSYQYSDRDSDAVGAFHTAVDCFSQGEDASVLAGTCLMQAASLEDNLGMYDQALADLRAAHKLPGGSFASWQMNFDLALLLSGRFGDLGAAREHAESSLRLAISSTGNLTLRAASLALAGALALEAGDFRRALDRFAVLLEMSDEQLQPTTIHLDRLYERLIVPPLRSSAAFYAGVAAEGAGMLAEARRYGELYGQLRTQPVAFGLPQEVADALADDTGEMSGVFEWYRKLAEAELLAGAHRSQEALAVLNEIMPLLQDHATPDVLVKVFLLQGIARKRLQDARGARASFHRVLDLLKGVQLVTQEIQARVLLGELEVSEGNFPRAYEHLSAARQSIETARTSLKTYDERLAFWQSPFVLSCFHLLVEACLRCDRFGEALEAVEGVKSRLLFDLLAEPKRRRLDFGLLTEERSFLGDREEWIRRHAARRIVDDRDAGLQAEIDMLQRSIAIDEGRSAIAGRAAAQDLFLHFESHATPLRYRDLRALCATP